MWLCGYLIFVRNCRIVRILLIILVCRSCWVMWLLLFIISVGRSVRRIIMLKVLSEWIWYWTTGWDIILLLAVSSFFDNIIIFDIISTLFDWQILKLILKFDSWFDRIVIGLIVSRTSVVISRVVSSSIGRMYSWTFCKYL